MYTKQQISKWLWEEHGNLRKLGIPVSGDISPDIRWSKATSWYGQCQKNKVCRGKVYKFQISISEYHLQSSEKAIRNTLVHELLHTCPGCFNHGAKWKAYANLVKNTLGYQVIRCGGDKEQDAALEQARKEKRAGYQTRYLLVCTKCGREFERFRKSNLVLHPENYRCKCGGTIEHKR
ncbi:MAG: SprT-like domain-containing protein [Firmicutes bacterium]|nr:SprT-like domain-containing protein [Bacillota bacterium]